MKRGAAARGELQPASVAPLLLAELLRESLKQGGRPLLAVTSNSMAPLFRKGDRIALEAVEPAALQPGDVVVFASDGSLISHRYWRSTGQRETITLFTKGDRQRSYDSPWPAEQLVGRVAARHRDGRQLLFTEGAGRRLNRQLARLAAVEMAWLSSPTAAANVTPASLVERLARRLVYVVACLMAASATLLARRSA
jgi:signal peptidase I